MRRSVQGAAACTEHDARRKASDRHLAYMPAWAREDRWLDQARVRSYPIGPANSIDVRTALPYGYTITHAFARKQRQLGVATALVEAQPAPDR